MNAFPIPHPSLGAIAARSAAVNIPLFGTAALFVAATYAFFTSSVTRRHAFLRALCATDCSDVMLVRYLNARDPIDMAMVQLEDARDEGKAALRKALGAAI